ncbi:hypothetical protein [uncultured Corynebacterium sp.]|uniref:hypothetical protein n=1 Tax=uncultured Corynebacterium sp. TaxID=159447 RepID=UPI0025F8EE20|nr:hypothetical protein [uncultured Corynebacterium sp.]
MASTGRWWGCLHVVQLLLAWLVVPETGGRNRQGHLLGQVLGSYATVLSYPAILGYLGSMSFGFSAMFCYISASPFVIQDVLGFSRPATRWSSR